MRIWWITLYTLSQYVSQIAILVAHCDIVYWNFISYFLQHFEVLGWFLYKLCHKMKILWCFGCVAYFCYFKRLAIHFHLVTLFHFYFTSPIALTVDHHLLASPFLPLFLVLYHGSKVRLWEWDEAYQSRTVSLNIVFYIVSLIIGVNNDDLLFICFKKFHCCFVFYFWNVIYDLKCTYWFF